MTRRTRRRQPTDSLELLLDTITNVFGGVVFLAMLIVLLLRSTSPTVESPSTIPPPDPTVLADRLQTLKEILRPLETEWQLTESVANRLADPRLRVTLTELRAMRGERDALTEKQEALAIAAARSQDNVLEIQEESERIDRDLEQTTAEIARLEQELEKERASREMKSSFPEERAATRRPHNVTIRYGRWYTDLLPDGSPNLDDFTILDSEGEYLVVTPKPYGGLPLSESGGLNRDIRRQIDAMKSGTEYVDISIWDDSYIEYQALRDYLVEHKLEYRLIVVTEGDEVTYGYVSDPRVQ